ncbi:MAG: zinc ribbon domain-containing protein [Clostridia bacterium]
MPKYSFRCKECDEEYTVNCVYEEKMNAKCPKCGSLEKKVIYKPLGYGRAQSVTERMGITEIPPHGHFFGEK